MDCKAVDILETYIRERLVEDTDFNVFIVWKAKILQNWKYMMASTLADNMYYELTYNGDKEEWYLDAYDKVENQVIPG